MYVHMNKNMLIRTYVHTYIHGRALSTFLGAVEHTSRSPSVVSSVADLAVKSGFFHSSIAGQKRKYC